MKRRAFLAAGAGVAAAAALPLAALARVAPAAPPLPIFWSDGVHDDAAGLQALIDGRPVLRARDGVVLNVPGPAWELPPGGRHLTRSMLTIRRPGGGTFDFGGSLL